MSNRAFSRILCVPIIWMLVWANGVVAAGAANAAAAKPSGSSTVTTADPLQFVSGSAEVRAEILKWITESSQLSDRTSRLYGINLEQLQVNKPMHNDSLQVDKNGWIPLNNAEALRTSTRLLYYIDYNGSTLIYAHTDARNKLSHLSSNGIDLSKIIKDLRVMDEVKAGKFEPRHLVSGSDLFSFSAIWLKSLNSAQQDLIYTYGVGKSIDGLKNKTLYTADEFLKILRPAVKILSQPPPPKPPIKK